MKLIIASNNEHKLREIKAILGHHFEEIVSLREAGIRIPELAVLVFVCTPEKPAKKEAPAKAAGDKTGGAKKSSGKTSPESLVDSVKKAAVKKAGSVKKAAADTAGSVKKAAADKAGSVKKAAADTADSVKKAATKKAKSVKNALSGNAAGGTEKVGQS